MDEQTAQQKTECDVKRMEVHAKTWTPDLDDGRTPVLVFCVNASRIGTDIESALRGVNDHRPVLVVLHCKNPSSLRGDLSHDDYLLDQALRDRVIGIAHFAFSEFDGFYSCRQNNDGFRKLSELLSRVTECKHSNLLTKVLLIKRCEQDNPGVRNAENEIIFRRNDDQTPMSKAKQFGTNCKDAIVEASRKASSFTNKKSKQDNTGWRNGEDKMSKIKQSLVEERHTVQFVVGWLIKRCEQDNPEVRNVEGEIIRQMDVREKTWTQDFDDGRTPVLVFCVNASSIVIDIESALEGVRNHRPVLVVLHCKIPSSLIGDLSDEDYLLDQALRDRVAGIAHFAFSVFDGFYSCRQNNDGYTKLDILTKAVDKTISRPHQLVGHDVSVQRSPISQNIPREVSYFEDSQNRGGQPSLEYVYVEIPVAEQQTETESTISDLFQALEDAQGTLAREKRAHDETQRNLAIERKTLEDSLGTLAREKRAHDETQRNLALKQKALEDAHDETRRKLALKQKALEDALGSLAGEQRAHDETRRNLALVQKTLEDTQGTLAGEQRAHDETRRNLAAEQQAHEVRHEAEQQAI